MCSSSGDPHTGLAIILEFFHESDALIFEGITLLQAFPSCLAVLAYVCWGNPGIPWPFLRCWQSGP